MVTTRNTNFKVQYYSVALNLSVLIPLWPLRPLIFSFFPRDLYPVDSCTVLFGHLRTLEHVMWVVAPTRLNHCLPPMDSESTWFTSVRSLAETDNLGRVQTGTDPVTSPGVILPAGKVPAVRHGSGCS